MLRLIKLPIPSTSSTRRLSMLMILGLLLVDLIWLPFSTLSFDKHSSIILIIVLTLSLLTSLFHRRLKLPLTVTNLAIELFTLMLFSCVGFIFSYLVTAIGGTLQDDLIVMVDTTLGFSWPEYTTFFLQNAPLRIASLIFYLLTPLLIIFAISWFCLHGETSRASTLVAMVILGGILCIGVSGFFPSAGAVGYFLPDQSFYQGNNIIIDSDYMKTFFDLREGTGMEVSFLQPVALVSFPSYHACMAFLVVLIFKGKGTIYWIMLVLNFATLFIIPVEGGHHLSDVLGGILVATLAYWSIMVCGQYCERVR